MFPEVTTLLRMKNMITAGVRVIQTVGSRIPGYERGSLLLQTAVIAGGSGGAVWTLREAYHSPEARAVGDLCRRTGRWAILKALKLHTASTMSRFLGNTIGPLATLTDKPLGSRTAVLAAVGAATGFFTASPVAATIAMETADAAIPQGFVERTVYRITSYLEDLAFVWVGQAYF